MLDVRRKSMLYDLDLVQEQCSEVGLKSEFLDQDNLAIYLDEGITLHFRNNVTTYQLNGPAISDDSFIDLGDDNPWHTHSQEFEFTDHKGVGVSMHYLDVLAGIASGDVLIGELRNRGKLKERWLFHKQYNDEFSYMEEGDEIRVRRISPSK